MSQASPSRNHALVFLLILIALLIPACRSTADAPNGPLPPEKTPASIQSQSDPTANTSAPLEPAVAPSATDAAPEPPDKTTGEQAWIAAVMAASEPETLQNFASPDGSYSVEVVRFECVEVSEAGGELAFEQLLVSGPDGEEVEAGSQLVYCGGLGAYGLNGLFFSPDSRYFYFDQARTGMPDGMACGYWYRGTSRLALDTFEMEALPGAGALSRDGSQMLLWDGTEFILWDVTEGEIARAAVPLGNTSMLSIDFSEDGTRAVVVFREDCIRPEALSSVMLLQLEDMTTETLVEASAPGYVQATWETAGSLLLQDFNGAFFVLSLSTGEISPRE